jgi:hypothetical protein
MGFLKIDVTTKHVAIEIRKVTISNVNKHRLSPLYESLFLDELGVVLGGLSGLPRAS